MRPSIDRRAPLLWLRRYGFAVHLAGCFLSVTAATLVVGRVEGWKTENNLLWVANGLLLAYLLLAPRRRWPAYLAAGFLGFTLRTLLIRERASEFLLYSLLDMVEVTIGALLLRRRSIGLPCFTERRYLVRFLAFAALGGPLVAGLLYVLVLPFWHIPAPAHPFREWVFSDALGIAICTPAFVAVLQTRMRSALDWRRHWYYPALLLAITAAAFAQASVPLFFFIYPLLVLIVMRLGLGFGSLCTLLAAAIAGWFTINGFGLFAAAGAIDAGLPSRLLQVSIAAAMIMIYTISVVLESQHATERRLQEVVALHELVGENSRDAIIVADFDGRRSYVSAAVERLIGWSQEEFAKLNSLDLVHPEDRDRAAAIFKGLKSGSDGARLECRVRNRAGDYLWVEASLRTVRNPATGTPTGLLNLVRDVTERKQAQQELQKAYKAVEAQAVTDALTGLANRRRFDECLRVEWRRALRGQKPLSLLMIDADLFKSYNDTYGHPRGDGCLKQIAEATQDVVERPGDLVARIGGEEFAILLPNTGNDGALQVAEAVCAGLRSRKLPHRASPFAVVTVSVGCATMTPGVGKHTSHLIELADQALYRAKRSGRNQVCNANAPQRQEEAAEGSQALEIVGGMTS